MPAGPEPTPRAALTPNLARLMAVTAGVTVANLYYAQPLLHTIGTALHTSQASASLLVTAAQLGYAAGLLFVVPAGDIVRRRPLLTALLAVCTLGLGASAVAPGLGALGGLALLIGLSSVVVQMLVPYAATLARPEERSRVIGTLMSGLLIGILASRTFSGIIAQLAGWRAVYATAAAMMALTTVSLFRALPNHPRELTVGYAEQMRGVLAVARDQPALRWRSLIGACGFAAFGCFWTTVTFLLAGPPYHFSALEIGLFALAGVAGAVTASFGGRLLDTRKHLRWPVTGITLAAMVASFAAIGFGDAHLGPLSLGLLIVGVLVMDACVQGTHVVNQSVIYDLLPGARSRLTTVYMTTYFVGGAIGTELGSQAYQRWGWTGASVTAAIFPVLALLAWLAARRHERGAAVGSVAVDEPSSRTRERPSESNDPAACHQAEAADGFPQLGEFSEAYAAGEFSEPDEPSTSGEASAAGQRTAATGPSPRG